MRFTSTVAGETLDDLTRRSYDLGDATSNDSIERARTALLDANPFLATLDSVPDGTVVTVPDLPAVQPPPLPAVPTTPDLPSPPLP